MSGIELDRIVCKSEGEGEGEGEGKGERRCVGGWVCGHVRASARVSTK